MLGNVHKVGRLAVGALVFVLAAPLPAQLPGRGRPIEFSEPSRSITVTNLEEIRADKTSLRKLDDEFKKPFELFGFGQTPGPNLNRMPPPRPVIVPPPSRSLQELLRKRDQWLEPGAEEAEGLGLSGEEMLGVPRYGPDGRALKPRSTTERYYDDLDRARAAARAAATNRAAADPFNAPMAGEDPEFKPLNLKLFEQPVSPFAPPVARGQSTSPELNLPGGFVDLNPNPNAPRAFSEIFGFGESTASSDPVASANSWQTRRRGIEDLLTLRFLNSPAGEPNPAPASDMTPPWKQKPLLPGPNVSSSGLNPASGSGLGAGTFGTAGNLNPGAPLGTMTPSLFESPRLTGAAEPLWGTPAPPPEPARPKLQPTPFQIPQRKF